MSARIRILPENLTNKIAAGEVVERPASVVKELVENSLDAGCGDLTVEIEGGGKRLIRVSDSGSGMSREDALLSLERHATSKVASADDLFRLTTLGFRGEAIPSIASVSRFHLASREKGGLEGTEIYAEGGTIREVKSCGMAEGTVISVRNLFFNTPARLKFMKSNETEAGHIGDLLTKIAISRPEVRFTYISDGKTVFRLLPGDVRSRVAALLGSGLAGDMPSFEASAEGITLAGLLGRPEQSRSSAAAIFTYINGRFIRDKVVQHAVVQSYRNVLERGRYPVVVLFIEVPADEVDVNVHPTKHEVRFREQGRVHDAIQAALEGQLRHAARMRPAARTVPAVAPPAAAVPAAAVRVEEVREVLATYQPQTQRQHGFVLPPPPAVGDRRAAGPGPTPPAREPGGYFSGLTVIGQFNAAYILCQDGDDLVIVDQHAAHERVAFEQLKREYAAGGVEVQGLLFPETMELSFREAASLTEHLDAVTRLGFAIENFGGNTWLLKAVPRILATGDYAGSLRDMLEELQSLGKSRTFAEAEEEILTRIACHSVVRGRRPMGHGEIAALFSLMDRTDFAGNCPHGRPAFRKIARYDIEKMFKRV
jgi:DNA mismatch repair protein MutL